MTSKWKWPEIEGRELFKGPMMHSANWDESVDFKDKTVAVIGAGSSGIQIVPALQPSTWRPGTRASARWAEKC